MNAQFDPAWYDRDPLVDSGGETRGSMPPTTFASRTCRPEPSARQTFAIRDWSGMLRSLAMAATSPRPASMHRPGLGDRHRPAGRAILTSPNCVATVAFSPDGNTLAAGDYGPAGLIKLWDWRTGKELRPPFRHDDIILGVSFSPDGRYLAAIKTGDWSKNPELVVWEVASGAASFEGTITDRISGSEIGAQSPVPRWSGHRGARR